MANYSIRLNKSQAFFLRRLIEEHIQEVGPDNDGYFSIQSDEDDDVVYLSEADMDKLLLEIYAKTDRL